MRIGIDGRTLTGRYTGDRTYWLNLLRALLAMPEDRCPHEFIVYSRLPIAPGLLPQSPRLTQRVLPMANDRMWTMITFPRALRQDRVDVGHTQYTTPPGPTCPIVTTVHDISFRIHPEWFLKKDHILLSLTIPRSIRRAAKVITVSESSREDINRIYGCKPGHVVATHLAAGPEYTPIEPTLARSIVKDKYGLEGPYVISVGVLQPRKNFTLLLRAFRAATLQEEDIPHKLVLTGMRGWGFRDLMQQAARLDIMDLLVLTDYVPDEDLPALYSAADVMAYPSLYEGFGLPPLEAMACGTATMVSDAPAMPEVAGGGAMVLPVIDANRWSTRLAELLMNPELQEFWGEKGLARAEAFSWAETARKTLDVYESVAR